MAGNPLGELFGNESVQQLFIWNVVSQLVSAAIGPGFRAAQNWSNQRDSNVPLTPDALAVAVQRGHMVQGTAASEAQKSGINNDNFQTLVNNTGIPPGPQQLAEALRRGFIPEGEAGSAFPSYLGGIAQGDIRNEWATVIKQLDAALPSMLEAVTAAVRNIMTFADAKTLFAQLGGDDTFFQLLYDNAGEGPSPLEAATAANRGIVSWDGTGPESVSFQQAVSESRFKNKWLPVYRSLARYFPPPRTITAMWREGSLDTAKATQFLQFYGVAADDVPLYLTQSKKSAVPTAHAATESEILALYEENAITSAEATDMLKSHGYTEQDIPILLEYGDLQVHKRQEAAVITPVHNLYKKGRMDYNTAKTVLTNNLVPEARADYLLTIWELERSAGTKDLTTKEVFDAVGAQVFTASDALNYLMGMGYSPNDAAVLMAINLGSDQAAQVTSQLAGAVQTLANPPAPQT